MEVSSNFSSCAKIFNKYETHWLCMNVQFRVRALVNSHYSCQCCTRSSVIYSNYDEIRIICKFITESRYIPFSLSCETCCVVINLRPIPTCSLILPYLFFPFKISCICSNRFAAAITSNMFSMPVRFVSMSVSCSHHFD